MLERFVLIVLVLAGTAGTAAAGNFAFAVPGAVGLNLEITGFGPDGSALFDQKSNLREDNGGTPSYVVRVDEAIIFKTRPAKWCVTDLSGNWSAIPNGAKTRQLCDSAPSETRGTYTFVADNPDAKPVAAPPAPPADIRFDIAQNVPKGDVATIKNALKLAEQFANDHLGGVDPKLRGQMDVTIVATGKGNVETGSNGDPATSFYHNAPGPFFDVGHQKWKHGGGGVWTLESYRTEMVAHEYGHLWLYSLGAFSQGFQTMKRWMNEGIATYYGLSTVVADHRLTFAQARAMELPLAKGEMPQPLDTLPDSIWPGDAGFLAIDWLVADSPDGILSLRAFASNLGKGQKLDLAFRNAFGLELSDFYRQFEPWRKIALSNPRHAFDKRPHLVLASSG